MDFNDMTTPKRVNTGRSIFQKILDVLFPVQQKSSSKQLIQALGRDRKRLIFGEEIHELDPVSCNLMVKTAITDTDSDTALLQLLKMKISQLSMQEACEDDMPQLLENLKEFTTPGKVGMHMEMHFRVAEVDTESEVSERKKFLASLLVSVDMVLQEAEVTVSDNKNLLFQSKMQWAAYLYNSFRLSHKALPMLASIIKEQCWYTATELEPSNWPRNKLCKRMILKILRAPELSDLGVAVCTLVDEWELLDGAKKAMAKSTFHSESFIAMYGQNYTPNLEAWQPSTPASMPTLEEALVFFRRPSTGPTTGPTIGPTIDPTYDGCNPVVVAFKTMFDKHLAPSSVLEFAKVLDNHMPGQGLLADAIAYVKDWEPNFSFTPSGSSGAMPLASVSFDLSEHSAKSPASAASSTWSEMPLDFKFQGAPTLKNTIIHDFVRNPKAKWLNNDKDFENGFMFCMPDLFNDYHKPTEAELANAGMLFNGNDFHIGKQLGKGSYGAVYEACHKKYYYPCAMKVQLFTFYKFQLRFWAEIIAPTLLTTEYFMVPLAWFALQPKKAPNKDKVEIVILMQRADESLEDFRLRQADEVNGADEQRIALLKKNLPIWRRIFEALEEMHKKNILHRDLKPQVSVILSSAVQYTHFVRISKSPCFVRSEYSFCRQ